jgi:pimeloyl-ACP methyl ester carboxylesterase
MSIVQVGSIRLNVVERGRGAPLVFVHGYPLDHSMWGEQLEGLADICRVIAPDLRGFGASDVTPGTVSMRLMADDVAGLLDALKIKEPIAFCGLSMGGYVAWQFALAYRARLAKLILCDTRAVADSADAAAGRRKTAERVLTEGSAAAADGLIPKLFAPATYQNQMQIVEATRQVILRTKPEGIAAALRGMAERPDVTSQLGEIDVPALLICGEHDSISPPDEMRQIAAKMPNAAYQQISEAGHMSPLEQPAAVNAAIREFVKK